MRKSLHVSTVLIIAGMCLSTQPIAANAETYHHHTLHHAHHSVHHSSKHGSTASHVSSSKAQVKQAQIHLQNLGYYTGKADGKLGPKTTAAVKKFQQHNGLKVDGKIGPKTMAALIKADSGSHAMPMPLVGAGTPPAPVAPATPEFYTDHPDFYGHVDQDYSNPMQMGVPTVPSRYARVDVHENTDANGIKSYDININDQPLFTADQQPAVIGISRTFSLDSEDVVIFTSYRPNDHVCQYKHYLLSLNASGSKMHEITNCTRGYQAAEENGTLIITFPEEDDARAVGATWKYDNGTLLRL